MIFVSGIVHRKRLTNIHRMISSFASHFMPNKTIGHFM